MNHRKFLNLSAFAGGGKFRPSLVLAPLFFFTLSSFTSHSGSSPSGQPSAELAVPAVQQQKVQQPKRTLRPQKVKGQKVRKRGVRRGNIIEYGTPTRTDSVHIIVPPADSIRTGHVEDAA